MANSNHVHYSIAKAAVEKIKAFWRYNDKYEEPDVRVRPVTFEIVSNMRNGYPPLLKEKSIVL